MVWWVHATSTEQSDPRLVETGMFPSLMQVAQLNISIRCPFESHPHTTHPEVYLSIREELDISEEGQHHGDDS
jgi:uncharacterized Zn-finger protein